MSFLGFRRPGVYTSTPRDVFLLGLRLWCIVFPDPHQWFFQLHFKAEWNNFVPHKTGRWESYLVKVRSIPPVWNNVYECLCTTHETLDLPKITAFITLCWWFRIQRKPVHALKIIGNQETFCLFTKRNTWGIWLLVCPWHCHFDDQKRYVI